MKVSDSAICHSCAGIQVLTPAAPVNPAGLDTIRYRIGAYHEFRESMVARLSSARFGAMSELTTRDPDDFTMALIDAWAVACDVLTFYSQRWMNEAFLATARERLSLHELAALTGYAPHPGSAASADLRFLLATEEGAPREARVPVGTKVQSTPAQDETPVIFETIEEITARPAWNALRPALTTPHALSDGTTRLYFAGSATGLTRGDGVFFETDTGGSVFALVRDVSIAVANVAEDPDAIDLTVATVEPLASGPLRASALVGQSLTPPTFEAPLDGYLGQEIDAGELPEILSDEQVEERVLFDPLLGSLDDPKEVLVFRARAAIFGHGAPELAALPSSLTGQVPVYGTSDDDNVIIVDLVDGPFAGVSDDEWAEGDLTVLSGDHEEVYLERVVAEIGAGSHVVLRDGDVWALYTVDAAAEASISRFTVTGKSTRLTLDSASRLEDFSIRGTTVFGASEWLPLAQIPLEGYLPAATTELPLNGWAPGLEPGRKVILTGRTAGSREVPVTLAAELAAVTHDLSPGRGTTLTLAAALGLEFARRDLRIAANVAPATQGESVFEVLGGGDPRARFQTFRTAQAPQTHVPAATASGAEPTLELRVDKLKWERVDNLLHAGPEERVYTLRIDPEGHSLVGFGDGVTGARPPAGRDNVRATYRKTHGLDGRVAAGQLNILMTQPLGVREVLNPLAAEGGADPETLGAIRENAPLFCRTLDRTVSLTDYADFARGYSGIAKSIAQWLHIEGGPRVVVTVAGEAGATVDDGGTVQDGLIEAMALAGDPYARFHVRSYVPRYFKLAVKVKPDPAYLPDDVLAAAEAALREAFSFEARAFGQPVFASEVIERLHRVEGVVAVIVDRLYRGLVPSRKEGLLADLARLQPGGSIRGAELLSLHPGPLDYLEELP